MPDIYDKFVVEQLGSRRFLVKWQKENQKHLNKSCTN
jgi:hypothetical protein